MVEFQQSGRVESNETILCGTSFIHLGHAFYSRNLCTITSEQYLQRAYPFIPLQSRHYIRIASERVLQIHSLSEITHVLDLESGFSFGLGGIRQLAYRRDWPLVIDTLELVGTALLRTVLDISFASERKSLRSGESSRSVLPFWRSLSTSVIGLGVCPIVGYGPAGPLAIGVG